MLVIPPVTGLQAEAERVGTEQSTDKTSSKNKELSVNAATEVGAPEKTEMNDTIRPCKKALSWPIGTWTGQVATRIWAAAEYNRKRRIVLKVPTTVWVPETNCVA